MTVKNTSELLRLVTTLANTISSVAADGKVSIMEYTSFLSLLPTIAPAIQGFGEIPAELADLDDAEYVLLTQQIAQDLDLDDTHESFELIVEQVAAAAFALVRVISELRQIKK